MPQLAGQLPYGYICSDQRLHLGTAQLSTAKIVDDLKQLGLLCKSARQVFGSVERFDEVLRSVAPLELEDGAPIPQSLEALRQVLDGSDIESRIYRSGRNIGSSAIGKTLSNGELRDLRALLLEGALVSTALWAFDEATVMAPENSLMILWRSLRGTYKAKHPVVCEYVRRVPFDKYAPHYLRYSLDKSAQRINHGNDGSPEISAMCEAEHRANQLLSRRILLRQVSIVDGSVVIVPTLKSKDDDSVVSFRDVQVPQLFHVMTLAHRSIELIQRLLTKEGVDLARLCTLADRHAGIDMGVRLAKLSPAMNARLSDVLDWSPLFESGKATFLSPQQRAELASLLLDAEVVLDIMDSLRDVLGQPWSETFWRSRWTRGISDKEIRVALNLLDGHTVFRDFDYLGPSELAMQGALALGYSQEDREGQGFGAPENPVQSLAWFLSQQGSGSEIETMPAA